MVENTEKDQMLREQFKRNQVIGMKENKNGRC